ncbi:hypothetical protein D3C79_968130 [compost metagenome]
MAQAQCIEDFGAGLADGDRTLGGVGEGLWHAAVVDRERVVGGSLGQASEAEASDQGGNTGQHGGAISYRMVHGMNARTGIANAPCAGQGAAPANGWRWPSRTPRRLVDFRRQVS